MSKLFIVSSAGDTDLAKETVKRMVLSGSNEPIHILGITEIAQSRIKDFPAHFPIIVVSLAEILGKPAYFHGEATPYLPRGLFSENLASFFSAKSRPHKCTRSELGLPDLDAPTRLMELMNA